jgi:hypothetical protein
MRVVAVGTDDLPSLIGMCEGALIELCMEWHWPQTSISARLIPNGVTSVSFAICLPLVFPSACDS